jgi:hypothetical protein
MTIFHLHGIVRGFNIENESYDVIYTHDYISEPELIHHVFIHKSLDINDYMRDHYCPDVIV